MLCGQMYHNYPTFILECAHHPLFECHLWILNYDFESTETSIDNTKRKDSKRGFFSKTSIFYSRSYYIIKQWYTQ